MHIERSIDIAAPPEVVWPVMSGVERWHEWTESITSVERLDDGPLRVGSRARVRQPLLRPAVFEVTRLDPGQQFTWTTTNGGIAAEAGHSVEPTPDGTRATLTLDFRGWPLLLLGWWVRWISNRYVTMELNGLKQRSEAARSEAGRS